MMNGGTYAQLSELSREIGVDRRTLGRWREWWQSTFAASRFWRAERARFSPPVDEAHLPASTPTDIRRCAGHVSSGKSFSYLASSFKIDPAQAAFPDRAVARKAYDLSSSMEVMDWDQAPEKLQSGDLSVLLPGVEEAIRNAATNEDVIELARTLGLDPVVLVIGLLAHAARSHRTAARIAHAIFGGEPPAEASAMLRRLGIERLPA